MEYVLSVILAILEMAFFGCLWCAFLTFKKPKKRFVFAIIAACMISICISLLNIPHPYRLFISAVYLTAIVRWLYNGPWYQHVLIVASGYVIAIFFDTIIPYAVSIVLNISYSQLVWKKLLYSLVCITGKLLAILFAWICMKIRKPASPKMINRKWMFLTILFSITSLAMILTVFYTAQNSSDLSIGATLISIIIVVSSVAILYLISAMEKSMADAQKITLLHQQMALQTDSIMTLEKSYRNQRKLTHDFNNQLQTILNLLTEGHIHEASEYIGQIQGMRSSKGFSVNSQHPIIDAVLNSKYQRAKELGIDFHITLNNLSTVSIDTNALVLLLSNLIDNAIEASCRVEGDKTIHCSIILDETLTISIRNTTLPVTINGDDIPTTKYPKEEHGYGLAQINYLLTQLGGEREYRYENGWFIFIAEIPI